jgi:hypothetical protein
VPHDFSYAVKSGSRGRLAEHPLLPSKTDTAQRRVLVRVVSGSNIVANYSINLVGGRK